jgi:predicted permease
MLVLELRDALAVFKKRPYFVLSVVGTLAVALGILLCMVNLNHVLLIKSLPYPNQERLVVGVGNVYENDEIKYSDVMAYPLAEHLEKHADVAALAIANFGAEIVTSLAQRPLLRVTNTTPRYFDMLGVSFVKGRPFAAENGVGSKEPVAILSYDTWQEYFSASDSVLNEKLVINNVTYRIIGVTARDFVEPELFQAGLRTHIWLPWEFNTWPESMRKNWLSSTDQIKTLALLRPGQDTAQAGQMLESLVAERFRAATQGSPSLRNGEFKFQVTALKSYLIEDGRVAALLFLASSIALAIIACINVFNLLLSRAAEQQRRLAISATLGANKRHIFRQVFAEHLLLTGLSMVLALVLAAIVTQVMRAEIKDQLPRVSELSLSPVTVLVALLLIIALALTFSGLVTHTIDYRRLAASLNSSGKGAGLQISGATRKLLVISQIGLAAFLLVSITSVLKVSYETVSRAPGFRVDNVVFANLSTGSLQLNTPERIRYIEEIKQRLRQLPQVSRVSSALFVPMMSSRWTSDLKVDPSASGVLSVSTNIIDEEYLAVMGQEILEGSNFSREDVSFSAKKVLVNEMLARKISPSGSVLGKQVYWTGDDQKLAPYEVVGVVHDVAIPRMPQLPQLYVLPYDGLRFIVEVKDGQELSREQFLNVLSTVNRSFNLYEYETVRAMYDQLTLKDRFIVWVAIGLGMLTVMLAGIGIYGVLSYGIQLRRYELGVRMSVGAGPGRIAALIYQENLKLVLIGAMASLVILVIADRLLTRFAGYQLPLTAATGALGYVIIVTSVAMACYLSLRAIITRWPVFALRTE